MDGKRVTRRAAGFWTDNSFKGFTCSAMRRLFELMAGLFLCAGCGAEEVSYSVYDPEITYDYVYDPADGPLSYNHDSSIEYFEGMFYAGWNGNTNDWEAREGQKNYWAVSRDGLNWSEHREFKNVPVFGSPNWQTEWQPNLFHYRQGGELWALWTKSGGFIHSVLSEDRTHWKHRVVFETVTVRGEELFLFPTQEPLQLADGTVLVPTVFRGTKGAHQERQYYCGTVLTRDGGKTWQVPEDSLVGHPEFKGPWVWEPMFVEQIDGRVRMFFRNEKRYEPTDKMLFSSLGNEDGTVFGPPEYSDIRTLCSRMWLTTHGTRRLMLHHDSARNIFSQDRVNIALFTSQTGRDDFVAGVTLTGEEVNVCYPQATIVDNAMYMIYTSGSVPRAIKVAKITPMPEKDKYYIMPRHSNRAMKIDNAPRVATYEKSKAAGVEEVQLYAGHYSIRSKKVNDLGNKSVTLTGWIRQRPQNVGVILNALGEDGESGFSLKEDWFDKLVLRIGGRDLTIGRKELYNDRYVRRGVYMRRDNRYRFFALVIDNETGRVHYWQDNKLHDEEITFEAGTDLSSGRSFYIARPELQETARNHYPYYGAMAEVNVFDRKLGEDEIRYLHNKYARSLGAQEATGTAAYPGEAHFCLNPRTYRSGEHFYPDANPLGAAVEHQRLGSRERLVFPGNSSAGVELKPYDVREEAIEITLPVRVDAAPQRELRLLSFADGELTLALHKGHDKLRMRLGDVWMDTVSFAYGKENEIVLKVQGPTVIIRNGRDEFHAASGLVLDGRLYLGDGYPDAYISPDDRFRLDVSKFKITFTK